MKPKLAAFPKCYMDELCVDHTMSLSDWIETGAMLGVQGLEFYSGFLEDNESFLRETKALLDKHRLQMPMLCCSPDFTEPDPDLLEKEIALSHGIKPDFKASVSIGQKLLNSFAFVVFVEYSK